MKEKITVCLIGSILFSFPIVSFFKEKETVSLTERRELEKFPKEDLLNFNKWENYLTDHFVGRETLKNLKGFITLNILQKNENKNTVEIDGSLYEINNTINEKSIAHITDLINKITTNSKKTNNVYYSIIPDKNYYLKDNEIPKLNYEYLFHFIEEKLQNLTYIPIINNLTLNLSLIHI